MSDLFQRFSHLIASATEAEIKSDATLEGRLLLNSEGLVSVFYAPFEHIVTSAKIVIVGITPGAQQASNAILAARVSILSGQNTSTSLATAKVFASFSGAMRDHLIAMLNHIGVSDALGINDTESLWNTNSQLAHFTSALRYPTFKDGKNYNGSTTRLPILRNLVLSSLAEEARLLPKAAWIPLGPNASEATSLLVKEGILNEDRVLNGLPHPSPANIERIRYFINRKSRNELSSKTDPNRLDEAKKSILDKISKLTFD